MPYTVNYGMSQFGDCTKYAPHTTATFAEALLFIKEQMLSIKGKMWEYILPRYQTFMGGLGPEDYPIEAVTTIPEQDQLLLFFGSSHSNCECWSFEITKS